MLTLLKNHRIRESCATRETSRGDAPVDSDAVTSPIFLVMIGLAVLVLTLALGAAAKAGRRSPQPALGAQRRISEDPDALDAEDLDELLEVTNAWRVARGLGARTLQDVNREYGGALR